MEELIRALNNVSDEELESEMTKVFQDLTEEQKKDLGIILSDKKPPIKAKTTKYNVQAQRIEKYMLLHGGKLSNWADLLRFYNLKTKSLDKYKEAMGLLWEKKKVYKRGKTFYLSKEQDIFMTEGTKELIKEVKPSNNPEEQQKNRERVTEAYLNTEDKSIFYDNYLNTISHLVNLAFQDRGKRTKEEVKKDILAIIEKS